MATVADPLVYGPPPSKTTASPSPYRGIAPGATLPTWDGSSAVGDPQVATYQDSLLKSGYFNGVDEPLHGFADGLNGPKTQTATTQLKQDLKSAGVLTAPDGTTAKIDGGADPSLWNGLSKYSAMSNADRAKLDPNVRARLDAMVAQRSAGQVKPGSTGATPLAPVNRQQVSSTPTSDQIRQTPANTIKAGTNNIQLAVQRYVDPNRDEAQSILANSGALAHTNTGIRMQMMSSLGDANMTRSQASTLASNYSALAGTTMQGSGTLAFQHLDDSVKSNVVKAMAARYNDPTGQGAIISLMSDPRFQSKLDQTQQSDLLQKIALYPNAQVATQIKAYLGYYAG
jgi:hypothetical protein